MKTLRYPQHFFSGIHKAAVSTCRGPAYRLLQVLPRFALLLCAIILLGAAPADAQEERQVAIFNKANDYYSKGQYKKAIILYRKARAEGISSTTCSFNLGNCYFQSGDLPAAAAAYRSAIGTNDLVSTDALLNLAAVLYRLGNFGESIAAYRRGLAASPDNISAWLYLSEAYEKTGDYTGTQMALEKALSLRPDDVSIVYQLAETNVALHQNLAAIDLVKRAYALSPAETDFLFYLADLYTLSADTLNALAAYRQALSADPDRYTGHYRIADLLSASGQQFLAMEHLDRALAIKPDFTDAAIFLGNISFDMQWWDRAAAAYTLAIRHNDQEGIIGIVNIVQEFMKRSDLPRARETAQVLNGVQIKDAVLKREWEKVVAQL